MNQNEINSLFAAIDAGNNAENQLVARVVQIVKLARIVYRSRQSQIDRFANSTNADSPDCGLLWDCLCSRGRFYTARFDGSAQSITVVFKDDWRGGPDYYNTRIPYSWLWTDDAELTRLMSAEIDAEVTKTDAREKAKEEQAEQERRAQYEALKEEFGSK